MIKIPYHKYARWIIAFIKIFECNCFRIFTIDNNIFILIYLFLVFLLNTSMFRVLNKKEYVSCFCHIRNYEVFLVVFILIQVFYLFFRYSDMTIMSAIIAMKEYALIFISWPLVYIFIRTDRIEYIMDILLLLIVITLGLALLQGFFVNNYNISIIHPEIYRDVSSRAGRYRIWDLSSLEGLEIIYAFYQVLYCNEKSKKKYYLMALIICVSALVYVEQTRAMILDVSISMIVIFVLGKVGSKNRQLGKAAIIFAGIVLAGTEIIPWCIEYYLQNMAARITITGRLGEISYALNIIKNNPIGIGMLSGTLLDKHYLYGVYSNYSFTDIGMLGYTVLSGIWIIFLFVWPMVRMFRILRRGANTPLKTFLIGIYVYLLITSATLFILDKYRIYMWPFSLALFEYYNVKSLKIKTYNG